MISVFGEVEVSFNKSSPLKPKRFNDHELKELDSSVIQMYIEPEDNWNWWRNQDVSSLNFTWALREFSQERMRIKMNIPDPTAISPYPKYDKLVIRVTDVKALFDNVYSSTGRILSHSELQAEFKKGIQKQMYDNRLGRDTVANVYIVRQTLVCLLLATFMLRLFFNAPLDRVYIMLLELQLMVNFAIFHVTLPGNVVIASTILKPLVSYNFLKILDEQGLHSLFGKDEAELASE